MRMFKSLALLGLISLGVVTAVPQAEAATITQIAQRSGQFNTLVTALKAAGLAGVLNGHGHYTVFAPTDRAFAALGQKTINDLLKPRNKAKLRSILLYHVLGKKVPSSALPLRAIHAKTLNGKSLRIRRSAHGVRVNSARVVKADINASNGVIHVIDQVLLP